MLNPALVMLPGTKRCLSRPEVEVSEEQSVTSNMPKCILMAGARPDAIWALLDSISEHGEGGVVLAPQDLP